MLIAAASSLWLTPWAIRERYRVENRVDRQRADFRRPAARV